MNVLRPLGLVFSLLVSSYTYAEVGQRIEELATSNAARAAFQIAEYGTKAVPKLKVALNHQNLQVRQYSAAILCEVDLGVCQNELKKKLTQAKVSEKEKIFYASFLYSSEIKEGRDFLVELVEKNKSISALQTLVDAYDRENLDLFFKLLNQVPEQNNSLAEVSQKRLVELCARGIRTVGSEENIKTLDSIMSRIN